MEEAFKINQKSSKMRNDSAVQGTNDSSVLSKISAAQLGYCKDDFLGHFAGKKARRSPLVNRGYYIRAKLIDYVIKQFLNQVPKKNQIVNLGAGFDSTFFRLKDQSLLENTFFIEIDFPDVINRKISLIKNNQILSKMCPDLIKTKEINGNMIYQSLNSNLLIVGIDLRNNELLEAILKSIPQFDENAPTFFLSEVVMTYMSVKSCNGLIKWISETFSNCFLSIYEQINPFDSFGQVMCSHFNKLGSPLKCILKYPFEEEQKKRYLQEGFSEVSIIKASDFYQFYTSSDEKSRIDDLELFDEYEPWHLKCSHYILISATKGDTCSQILKNMYPKSLSKLPIYTHLVRFDSSYVGYKAYGLKFGSRFGHSVCALGSKIFVFGGFGELATDPYCKHLRLTSVEVVDLKSSSLKILELPTDKICDRIFHCAKNTGKNSMVISFGRSNPSKMFKSITKVIYNEKEDNLEISEHDIELESVDLAIPRFRHAMCPTPNSEIFIYGGKFYNQATNTSTILNDAYIVDSCHNLKPVQVDSSILSARHSVCINQWQKYLIISGGLDAHENPLNDIIFFDCETLLFKKLELNKGFVLPRYSHSSHVIDDTLILVGGANFDPNPPGLCFINLNTLIAIEFDVPNENRLMLVCHQSHMIDRNSILVIGGGAVCFTFGTHLNKYPSILDLSKCWLKFSQY